MTLTLIVEYVWLLNRVAAARASLLYFIMNDLHKINPMYQFSLKAFSVVFEKAIDRAEPAEELKQRVLNLIDCITYSVYVYTTRGLFEKDKLIFGTQMTFLVSLLEVNYNCFVVFVISYVGVFFVWLKHVIFFGRPIGDFFEERFFLNCMWICTFLNILI